jgi:hypothetical protein
LRYESNARAERDARKRHAAKRAVLLLRATDCRADKTQQRCEKTPHTYADTLELKTQHNLFVQNPALCEQAQIQNRGATYEG